MIPAVTNPPAGIGLFLTVDTSSDTPQVHSATYAITAPLAISAPTVALTTRAASATGVDYVLTFKLSSTGALTGTDDFIQVAAPAGTSFLNANNRLQVLDTTSNQRVERCCTTLSNSNQTIKLAVQGAAAGDTLRVFIPAVKNPAAGTGLHLSVWTSSDTTPVSSAAYAITAPLAISAPTVALTTRAASATGVDYVLTVKLSSTGALTGTDDFIKVTVPAGTSFANVNNRVQVVDSTLDERVERCCTALSNSNQTITIPVQGAAAGDTVRVLIQAVNNPTSVASGLAVSAFTSSDTTPVNFPAYSITTAQGTTQAKVVPSASTPGATGVTYVVKFNTSSTGALTGTGDFIRITVPAGTSLAASNAIVLDVTTNLHIEQCCGQVTNSNRTITIPVQGAAAGDRLRVQINSVANPPGPSASRTLTVETSSDTAAVASLPYTI
jgi:predicted RNA-binding protein with TRAM domain